MGEQISAPVIRTLLLTDLCDSVSLVEQIGDVAAAGLFRSHDRLVLELQQRWAGRLIDRSDGMLLVFERPLHGIGFALDYLAELETLGRARGVALQARAGLHVGEVLLWENSREAIAAGAKPLEVEGLAKPIAARLLAMARPRQVLVSAVTEALARRASKDDLGSLRDRLVWKSHGAWLLKGVPTAQDVFEVGLIGEAPLRKPLAGPKARRALPLWRRPAALAAQALLAIGLVAGSWYATRSEPAIAFAQREWVVLAGWEAGHPDAAINDAMQQALRIALEQSSHLNLISDEQLRASLPPGDAPAAGASGREAALAAAQREGARMVIVPVLEKHGSGWRFSLELVEPLGGRTLRKSVGMAEDDQSVALLGAVDEAARGLRAHLGETMESIQASDPLPQVTTSSLPALRAYALAEKSIGEGDFLTAEQLFAAALEADPDFALAHMGQAKLLFRLDKMAQAREHLERALQHRERLPLRERLYLDAWSEELSERGWPLERWEALARLFPDFAAGPANASWYLLTDNRFVSSQHYARSVGYSRHPMRSIALMTLARGQLGQGDYDQALETLADMEASNGRSSYMRGDVLAARGDEQGATKALMTGLAGTDPTARIYALRGLVSTAASSGDCAQMDRQARLMQAETRNFQAASMAATGDLYMLQAGLCAPGARLPAATLQQHAAAIEHSLKLNIEQGANTPVHLYLRLLGLTYLAQRGGQSALAEQWLQRHHEAIAQNGNPMLVKLLSVVQARLLLQQGHPQQALDHLSAQLDGAELYQARVVMRDAYRALGQDAQVAVQQQWLLDQAGRAWAEVIGSQQLQPLNVLDLAQARRLVAAPAASSTAIP